MRPLTILILTVGLFACNDKTEKQTDSKPLTKEQQEEQQLKKIETLKLEFEHPVFIDSSSYVMYPLELKNNGENDRGLLSSSYSSPTTYWNIIFYNTANGQYHLLDDKRKMIIYAYDARNSNGLSSSYSSFDIDAFPGYGYDQVDKLICYEVTTFDYNNDGKITSEDPNYLFISDKAGKNFKQISPDSLNVTSWERINAINKILIQTIKDTNHDKKFNDKDDVVPFIYDSKTGGLAKEVFSNDFKMTIKKLLDKQWTKKE